MMKTTFVILGMATSLLTPAMAQQAPFAGVIETEVRGADQTSPLGARQQRIKRLLNDLEAKFTELAAKLEEEQPDQAKKLREAFNQSKELLLAQRMDEITALLDGAKFESATDEQGEVVTDLRALLDLLLYEESEFERLQREIQRLEKWKEALDDLIVDETELKEESDLLADPEKAKADLDARIQRTKDLIQRQQNLLDSTQKNDGSDVDALDQLADEQAELRKETEALAEELSPADADDETSQSPQQRASQSLNDASKGQGNAEKQLARGKPREAENSEKEALKNLESALKTLEDQRARLNELEQEEAGAALAQGQMETAAETENLGDQMAQESEPKQGETSPAENVQNAEKQMNQAAQQLGQSQPGPASKNQGQAIEELNQAREKVERQLNELRDQAQQEQIAQLQEIFKNMLERQRQVSGGTRDLDERRGGAEKRLRRADRIELRKWAREERGLEEDAKEAEDLLVEDGTSVVFRDIVGYLRLEIGSAAALMEHQNTGPIVQRSHREIESTLEELIASLEDSGAFQGQPQGQPQGGGQQRQSLFPPLAELRLLKFTQERINRQTLSIERARGQEAVAEILTQRFRDAARMQDKLTNMARELASLLQPTMTQEDPNAID